MPTHNDDYPFVRLASGDIKIHIVQFDTPQMKAEGWDLAVCGTPVDADRPISRAEWWKPDTCGECFRNFGERILDEDDDADN